MVGSYDSSHSASRGGFARGWRRAPRRSEEARRSKNPQATEVQRTPSSMEQNIEATEGTFAGSKNFGGTSKVPKVIKYAHEPEFSSMHRSTSTSTMASSEDELPSFLRSLVASCEDDDDVYAELEKTRLEIRVRIRLRL